MKKNSSPIFSYKVSLLIKMIELELSPDRIYSYRKDIKVLCDWLTHYIGYKPDNDLKLSSETLSKLNNSAFDYIPDAEPESFMIRF